LTKTAVDTGVTPDGLDASEIAGKINDNDYLVEKETEFGENMGEVMNDNGTISEADRFNAESDFLAQQYEEIPEETPIPEEQLDGQMELEDSDEQSNNK